MTELLRLSEHPLSQQWLARFRTTEDRRWATQLLDQLKLVSARDFESGIERALIDLQVRLQATIAVYPIAPPMPDEIVGYDPFEGGVPADESTQSREVGRRRKFGSEDRVGHVLAKLQARFRKGTGPSSIECVPTLMQLKTQGIRHIVLVDDVCGSGKRIIDYWRSVPRRIKSLLSLKKCELWIVLYAITSTGKAALTKAIPNFPLSDHLITVLPEADLGGSLTPELRRLCVNYAEIVGLRSSGLGYRGSACPIVFEHGCPNNVPAILWANHNGWKGLFPNRAIPTDMRSCFDSDGTERQLETLWQANQPKLALSLLAALDHEVPLTTEHRMLLTMLGLRLRGVPEGSLARRLLIAASEAKRLRRVAEEMGLYDEAGEVTRMGREFVTRFRERFGRAQRPAVVGKNPQDYYPDQCEGETRELGITDRGNGRSVPVEPK
jgi:hypothetical protein